MKIVPFKGTGWTCRSVAKAAKNLKATTDGSVPLCNLERRRKCDVLTAKWCANPSACKKVEFKTTIEVHEVTDNRKKASLKSLGIL